ncbi:MAG: hypothetical protein JF588_16940 [Caulobacterales bacterium]|nr:hypothetical protein [Caulobacterales bacterium]
MKNGAIPTIAFYVAAAACLWPLSLNAAQVVGYVQGGWHAHNLVRLPPRGVLVAAAETALLLWALPSAVMLFRKGQDSYAWLVVLLVLAPTLTGLALR